jgi:hypothetical protein
VAKNIVIYSDGTGQDGGARPEQRISNIYKMYRISRDHADTGIDPSQQVVFYDAGLGTDVGTTALTAPVRFVQKMLGSVAGDGIKRNIADCYEFIVNHHEDGDRIFLFGFSRGAYTVRSLANLLMLCGVPTKRLGGPLMRYRKAVKDIAWEAVDTVLEHGAGHPREEFEAERLELARRFQVKYGSGDGSDANAAAYFIGVFDTVAALGASGTRRLVIQAGLTAGVAATAFLASLVPAAIIGVMTAIISDAGLLWGFIVPAWAVTHIAMLAAVIWFLKRQRTVNRKTIYDFPNKGDPPRSHDAEWTGKYFDRLLSKHVRFARSANAIDETRKDFDRVGWGGTEPPVHAPTPGVPRLIQVWFAGNHSESVDPIRSPSLGSPTSPCIGCASRRFRCRTDSRRDRYSSIAQRSHLPATLVPRSTSILRWTVCSTARSPACAIRSTRSRQNYQNGDGYSATSLARTGRRRYAKSGTTPPSIRRWRAAPACLR